MRSLTPITLPADPVEDLEAATKQYVDAGGGGGAPTTADYLVGTAQAGLSAEIVVGATPGGELGGTWASPTVDATHSGSVHHAENHASRHENGGADEIDVTGLTGAGGGGTPDAHAASHENGGSDEIDVTGLTGAGGGSGIDSGTSFPGSPSTDDIFYRSDRDLLYFYDGTRWLTINEYELPQTCRAVFGTGISATATISNLPARQDYDIYVTRFEATPFANTGSSALSGSHKWVSTLDKLAADNTPTNVATLSLDSGNSGEWQKKTASPNEVVTAAGFVLFRIIATKTGTPGSLICSYRVLYRLVG